MAEESKKQIIEQLERLEQLLKEAFELDDYVENGVKKEYIPQVKKAMKTVDDLTGTPTVFGKFPTFPIDGSELPALEKEYLSKKKKIILLGMVTGALVFTYWQTFWSFLNTLSCVGIFAIIIMVVNFSQSRKKYFEKKKVYDASMETYRRSMKAFRDALIIYEQEKEKGIKSAQAFKDTYKNAYDKYDRLAIEYIERRNDAMGKYCEKVEEAQTIDFVPPEYYHLIRPIIVALKSGRADDYKEALNLAIQEEREEQAEAARRAEEARKTQILEQQAADERRRLAEMERHNREMEQQQQVQQKMMLDAQRRQEREAARQQQQAQQEARRANEEARRGVEKQASQNKMAGVAKCGSCANSKHCPSHIKNSGAGLTCGGYRPYK